MNAIAKKMIIVAALFALPLIGLLADNFVFHRRGWNTIPNVQFNIVFGSVRVFLAPLIVLFLFKFWVDLNRPVRLLVTHLLSLTIYIAVNCCLTFIILKIVLSNGVVNGNRDLFDRIKDTSLPFNSVIYIIVAGTFYLWTYYDRSNRVNKQAFQAESQGINNKILSQLSIKTGTKTVILPIAEISWFRADGPYVQVYSNSHTYLIKQPLYELQKILPDDVFMRIHRSCIINISCVKEIRSLLNGDYTIFLKDGSRMRASRTYKEDLQIRFGKI